MPDDSGGPVPLVPQDHRTTACYGRLTLPQMPGVGKGMNNRRSIRRPGHDYTRPGDYFVTVCVRNRAPPLGVVDGEEVVLSALGSIVRQEWTDIPERFPMVRLDEFTIMPNHVHGIITIVGVPLAGTRRVDQPDGVDCGDSHATRCGLPTVRAGASPAPTLGGIIGAFKSLSDRRCRETVIAEKPQQRFGHLWQRNYHEHIVGDQDELKRIQVYIRYNPRNWTDDPNFVPDQNGQKFPTNPCT